MERKKALLGVDIGTTGVKSMLFDRNGEILGESYREYSLIFSDGGIEQDAGQWYENAADTAREALKKSALSPRDVAAMAVSTQGIACVPTDADGAPLSNAISWMDTRSIGEARAIAALWGDETLFRRTGKNPACYTLAALLWLKENRPELFARARRFLLPQDYMLLRLTGNALTDPSMACGTMAYDIEKHAYMRKEAAALGVDTALLSPVGKMGERAGGLTARAAARFGLWEGMPVAIGAQDQNCAALGAGIGPGVAVLSLGTAAALGMLTDPARPDPKRRVTLVCMGDDRYLTQTVVNAAGAALKWFRGAMAPDMSYDDICEAAAASCPGARGVMFFPGLNETDLNRPAGCFTGLRLDTTRADLARAVLEGVSYAIARELNEHERVAGRCRELRVFGGGAQSAVWRQMLADMTLHSVALPETHETACLGAAVLAAKATGLIDDLYAPGELLRPPRDVRVPCGDNLYAEPARAYAQRKAELGL